MPAGLLIQLASAAAEARTPAGASDGVASVAAPRGAEVDVVVSANGGSRGGVAIAASVRSSQSGSGLAATTGSRSAVDVPAGDLSVRVQALDARGQPLAAGLATAESEIFTSNPCEDQIEVRVPLSLCETVDCSDE